MFALVLALIIVIFTLNYSLSDAITSSEQTLTARQMGKSLAQCFGENELFKCFENKISQTLDRAIVDNQTWPLSDFLVIEKNIKFPKFQPINKDNINKLHNITKEYWDQGPLSNPLVSKMLQLVQTRSLRFQLPSSSVARLLNEGRISAALDDFNAAKHNVDTEVVDSSEKQEEGRKRKDKDKHIAMMGGMTMLAMLAQMFLGKVILIAGAAFIMAKVALLVSALGSLKKGAAGSGGEHVIFTGGSHGGGHSHEHITAWRRRVPYEQQKNEFEEGSSDDYKFTEPIYYNEYAESGKFNSKNQYKKPPIKKNSFNKIIL